MIFLSIFKFLYYGYRIFIFYFLVIVFLKRKQIIKGLRMSMYFKL